MKTHGEVLKEAGLQVVRVDVESPARDGGHTLDRVRSLSSLGLSVMAVVKPGWLAPYRRGWQARWRGYVDGIFSDFDPLVDYWQIGNELNHPYHSFHPSLSRSLRRDLIAEGCASVKETSRAKTIVNMYTYLGFGPLSLGYLHQLVSLVEAGVPIDVLGVDMFRGTYAPGGPFHYTHDLLRALSRWGRSVMITETGYSAPWLWRTEEDQSRYFTQLFGSVHDDHFLDENPRFLGTLVYVYTLDRVGPNPEDHFGMVRPDGSPKLAWGTVVEEARRLRGAMRSTTFGVTSHVDERAPADVMVL